MTTSRSSAFGSRYFIYRHGDRGCAYNPSSRDWELYEIDPSDGSIQDLLGRTQDRAQAMRWIHSAK